MSTSKLGEFCWNELATTNVIAAKEFYRHVLGWQYTEEAVGDMIYTLFRTSTGDKSIGGIWEIPIERHDKIPPHWMGYILVENIKDTLDKAIKHGATVKVAVTQFSDMGLFAVVVDPTGAHIAFWEAIK
ncbi:VOC family protein [Legionella longbeachae]|uniref:Putative glyoxalase/bleomycin resistance protein n=1 Tax=Legionella longbeachae serogroup 1 (strain NSW150) TaxID=661367 RepID=D3HRG9_LEGLN|nr:VOC family protein [Legionella longbeachae]VEE02001.1 glyoxalase/bleomycin resistance protein [Legionella oakridgensis]HBD7396749.1 VOC family protein [Legionella pneumophila]ARB91691.1 VOC family protein [Legionella longbeachae]ARM35165.1 VOC family protein [Legionella longbeachae]EEZ95390.1 glyoxalase family protein [Legionella longbeachae D-4968]